MELGINVLSFLMTSSRRDKMWCVGFFPLTYCLPYPSALCIFSQKEGKNHADPFSSFLSSFPSYIFPDLPAFSKAHVLMGEEITHTILAEWASKEFFHFSLWWWLWMTAGVLGSGIRNKTLSSSLLCGHCRDLFIIPHAKSCYFPSSHLTPPLMLSIHISSTTNWLYGESAMLHRPRDKRFCITT